MSEITLLEKISEKMDRTLRLLAVIAVKDLASEQEKIELLDSLGFTSSDISMLLNKSIQNVCVQLNIISKKKERVGKASVKNVTENTANQALEATDETKRDEIKD